MKINTLAGTLAALLLLSSLATAGLTFWYLKSIRQVRSQQPQLVLINNNRVLVQSLLTDIADYRRKNPTIDPILQSVNLLPGSSNSAVVTPSPAPIK